MLPHQEAAIEITRYFEKCLRTSFDSITAYLEVMIQPRTVFIEELYPDYPYAQEIPADYLWYYREYFQVTYDENGLVKREEYYLKNPSTNEFTMNYSRQLIYSKPEYQIDETPQIQTIITHHVTTILGTARQAKVIDRFDERGNLVWVVYYEGEKR